MKRVRNFLGLAAVAAVIGAVPAISSAVVVDPLAGWTGPIVIKYFNFDEGAVYNTDGLTGTGGAPLSGNGEFGAHGGGGVAALNAIPQTSVSPPAAVASSDGWGIFRVESITDTTGTIDIYQRTLATYEITGIFWGLQDTYIKVTDNGLATEQQDIHSNGVHIAFFTDSAENFNPLGGPAVAGSWAGGDPVYPTVTDGDLLWSLNSTPGFIAGDTDEFFTFFKPQAGGPGAASSSGGMLADTATVPFWGTGAFNYRIANSVDADMEVNFTADTVGAAGFLLHSDDPIRAQANGTTVPEPISAGLSLLGLAGLGLIASRRRTA